MSITSNPWATLSFLYWKRLQHLTDPLKLMKFSLTYQGDLPASGNKSKPADVARIRNCLRGQFVELWESHVNLRELERTARVPRITVYEEATGPDPDYSKFELEEYRGPIPPLRPGHVDLCAPLKGTGGTSATYRPIVRKSLGLACALDILFLRQEEPGQLVLQGGDIDGRMKTLFDALRMPTKDEEDAANMTPTADPLQCLLENDSLITDLSIRTGRLLGVPVQKRPHRVHLVIVVTIKVLRFSVWNQCLVGV